ncbi:MAG: acylphosphatase [Candidatus Aminicenantes bacterium]|nr:acylphosphatase [Candidatus Aminicenantes bacterium]
MAARLHAWVSGRVQGVCFRDYVQRRAGALALTGWVRNLGDGRVEVVAEGGRSALDELADRLRTGPPAARVDALEIRWEEPAGEFGDFRIVRADY